MFIRCLVTLLFFSLCYALYPLVSPIQSKHTKIYSYITNKNRNDGFGSQFQGVVYIAIYAELNGASFVYTPFSKMEHNYENTSEFLAKKEQLINIQYVFPNIKECFSCHSVQKDDCISFIEGNIKKAAESKTLQQIKHAFRANKSKNYYGNNKFNIAVHVRRPNMHDSRLAGADVPDETFLDIINYLKKEYAHKNFLFHIYSQGHESDFALYQDETTILHLNESVEDTFTGMVYADALVISPSSFSYIAGWISNGTVYYQNFWHKPLPHWIQLSSRIDKKRKS